MQRLSLLESMLGVYLRRYRVVFVFRSGCRHYTAVRDPNMFNAVLRANRHISCGVAPQ